MEEGPGRPRGSWKPRRLGPGLGQVPGGELPPGPAPWDARSGEGWDPRPTGADLLGEGPGTGVAARGQGCREPAEPRGEAEGAGSVAAAAGLCVRVGGGRVVVNVRDFFFFKARVAAAKAASLLSSVPGFASNLLWRVSVSFPVFLAYKTFLSTLFSPGCK